MGTRADFYVGTGPNAMWLGSVAFDGYAFDERPGDPIMSATTEKAFRAAVSSELAKRDDATLPEYGWPWPWDDSSLTDYAYCFEGGKVTAWTDEKPPMGYPDMSKRKAVTFGRRSGLIALWLS